MAKVMGSDSMKVDTRDILKIGEYGFVRNLHPAFNVSQNRYGHKSSYTKNLFYALKNRSSKTIFFSTSSLFMGLSWNDGPSIIELSNIIAVS